MINRLFERCDKVKKVYFLSNKGGVGKTFVTYNCAVSSSKNGFKTLVIDADIFKRCMDIYADVTEGALFDYADVISGVAKFDEAYLISNDNLHFLLCPFDTSKITNSKENFDILFDMIKDRYDYVFIDMPSGDSLCSFEFDKDDTLIYVTEAKGNTMRNLENMISSVNKTDNTKLIINRVNPYRIEKGYDMGVDEVIDQLRIPLLGVIYDFEDGFDDKMKLVSKDDDALCKKIFDNIIVRLGGDECPIAQANKKSLVKKLFG